MITPVFDEAASTAATPTLLGYVASRAHHAEIGGIRPGSMPPFSKNLAEEGVLICNFAIIRGGKATVSKVDRALRLRLRSVACFGLIDEWC